MCIDRLVVLAHDSALNLLAAVDPEVKPARKPVNVYGDHLYVNVWDLDLIL